MCKNVRKASSQPGLCEEWWWLLLQSLESLPCIVHQVRQTAVEGQGAHTCAELGKKFFMLPPKGLCLFPEVKGRQNMGCDGDVGGRHALDGDWGADGGGPPTASTGLGPHGASRR